MSPSEFLYGTKTDVERHLLLVNYHDNRSSYVLYVPGCPRPTFVSTNNVLFGNKCPMAKGSPDFIDHPDTVLDFSPEANVSDIRSNIGSILDQTETHYILKTTNDSVMSMANPVFDASLVQAQNGSWLHKTANIMNQLSFLQEVNSFASDCFFNAEVMHFTDKAKYVDPTSYADVMSQSNAKLWQEAFDKEMNGLVSRNVFSVVDQPADQIPLGTTMIYKYKIKKVKNTLTSKCILCLLGDRQKEGVDFFKHQIVRAVLNSSKNRTLYAQQQPIIETSSVLTSLRQFTYGKLDVQLYCLLPPGFKCPKGTKLFSLWCKAGSSLRQY